VLFLFLEGFFFSPDHLVLGGFFSFFPEELLATSSACWAGWLQFWWRFCLGDEEWQVGEVLFYVPPRSWAFLFLQQGANITLGAPCPLWYFLLHGVGKPVSLDLS
jgi:hypothetical protein